MGFQLPIESVHTCRWVDRDRRPLVLMLRFVFVISKAWVAACAVAAAAVHPGNEAKRTAAMSACLESEGELGLCAI